MVVGGSDCLDVQEPDIDIDLVAVVCRRVSFRRFLRHLPGVLSAADGVTGVHTVEGRVGHLSMNVNGVDVDVLLARLPYVTDHVCLAVHSHGGGCAGHRVPLTSPSCCGHTQTGRLAS